MKYRLLLILTGLLIYNPPVQAQRKVAISIDDLPYVGKSLEDAKVATTSLLETLASHQVTADLFIIGQSVEIPGESEDRTNLMRQWRDNRHLLHNHSYSHPAYSKIDIDDYLRDVEQGHNLVRSLINETKPDGRVGFFRAPYNDLGETAETRQYLISSLQGRDVQLAPFTVEHSDWMFNALYEDAIEQEEMERTDRIALAYLAQLDSAFTFAEGISSENFGREIPQIFLIHANKINAHHLDAMLNHLKGRGYQFITMREALTDPAYNTPDLYLEKWGVSWLHRWRVALELPKAFRQEPGLPDWITEAFAARSN